MYLGGARESGARNGLRISVFSVIINYRVNKNREERRVTKQAGRYLPLRNASFLGEKITKHNICQAL